MDRGTLWVSVQHADRCAPCLPHQVKADNIAHKRENSKAEGPSKNIVCHPATSSNKCLREKIN